MPIKSVKIKISKNKKFHFLRVTSRVLCPNPKSLAQTVLESLGTPNIDDSIE